jgi:hypothetical protein
MFLCKETGSGDCFVGRCRTAFGAAVPRRAILSATNIAHF